MSSMEPFCSRKILSKNLEYKLRKIQKFFWGLPLLKICSQDSSKEFKFEGKFFTTYNFWLR